MKGERLANGYFLQTTKQQDCERSEIMLQMTSDKLKPLYGIGDKEIK